MHEPVLVNADIDERPERGDIGDDALEYHARLEVVERFDAGLELRGLEGGAWIASRLLQFAQDVRDGGQAEPVVDERSRRQCPQRGSIADQGVDLAVGRRDDPVHDRIGFGMHRRGVERIVAGGDSQEARTLLERLGSEPRYLLQRLAGPERTVRVAVGDDALGQRLADARDTRQQRRRRRVQVHAHAVDAVLDHRVERSRQLEFA